MTDPKYKDFTALDPFFDIVQRGLAGQVDGDHYFDTIADNAVFEFRYIFPGWPRKLDGREAPSPRASARSIGFVPRRVGLLRGGSR
jgi:hypothetical protein